jgi:hypothetical protein
MVSEDLHELPEPHEGLAGESIEKDKSNRYTIKVSNARGYLCHITMEVTLLELYQIMNCSIPIHSLCCNA